ALALLAPVFLGDTGPLQPRGGSRPGVGQEEAQGRREMPLGADIMDRDGDLAVGLLAQLAAILVLDADGVLPLLRAAGIVDEEDPSGTGESLSHHAPVAMEDLLFVPGALVDELLEGLFGVLDVEQFGREWDPIGSRDHGFDALAFAIADQAAEVDTAPGALGGMPEVVMEALGVIPQPFQDFRSEFWRKGSVHTI